MPTIRLQIKFSKPAFLDTLEFAINRACFIHLSWIYHRFLIKFPQRCFGRTNPVKRSFQAPWFSNRTWLHYDEANDLAFCHICSVAYRDGKLNNHTLDKAFIINGFSNRKDASVSFKIHDSSKCHDDSVDIVLTLPRLVKHCRQNTLRIRFITEIAYLRFCLACVS